MAGPLRVEQVGGVLLMTLDRPERRNALSIELRQRIADELAALDTDALGCVAITGAGPAFCSGMDTAQFGGSARNRRRLFESSVACMRAVGGCPLPVIAAVNGPALAGGFVLALAADLRLAAPSASFGFPELGRGIPPAFAWARAALPAPLARELCLSGRVVDGGEASREGIVSELVDEGALVGRALELGTEIASRPRGAILEVKRRILLERQRLYGFLLADEEEALSRALLDA